MKIKIKENDTVFCKKTAEQDIVESGVYLGTLESGLHLVRTTDMNVHTKVITSRDKSYELISLEPFDPGDRKSKNEVEETAPLVHQKGSEEANAEIIDKIVSGRVDPSKEENFYITQVESRKRKEVEAEDSANLFALKAEYSELCDRIINLTSFLLNDDRSLNCDLSYRNLMYAQHKGMDDYRKALKKICDIEEKEPSHWIPRYNSIE